MADNDFPTVAYFQDDEVITADKLNTLANAAQYAETHVVSANSNASQANQLAQSVINDANQAKDAAKSAQQSANTAANNASSAKSLASDANEVSQNALAKINAYVDTTNLVNLNTDQTLTGVKTFTKPIVGSFQTHQINSYADLNNYQQDGKYFFSQAPKNAPFDKPAIVLIQSGVNQSLTPNTQLVIQTIYDFENIKHPEVRTYNNGNWSNWQLLGGEINTAKLDKDNSFTGNNTFNKTTQFIGDVALKATVHVANSAEVQFDSPVNCNATINANGGIKGTTAEFNDLPVPIQNTSADLNTLGTQGHTLYYHVSSAVTNAPVDPDTSKPATQGIITDKCYDTNTHVQTYEDTSTGYTYSRHYTNSAWSNWILLTPHN